MNQRFPKSCRLLDAKAYKVVFDNPDFRVSNKYFLVLGSWTTMETARMGVIVAKKNVAKATQRNRIKRLVREAFRTRCAVLDTADLVVMAKKGLQHLDNSECYTHIHALMDEINKKKH